MLSSRLGFDSRSAFLYVAAVSDESILAESAPTRVAPIADVGPDPVWGVALGAFGLINMAVAGAMTRHYWFNVGEGLMALGAALFIGSAAITHLKQVGVPSASEVRQRIANALRRK